MVHGVAAHHEAVDVVDKDQRDVEVLVQSRMKRALVGARRRWRRRTRCILAGVAGVRLVLLLVGDDADGRAADARVAAEDSAASQAVLIELERSTMRDELVCVVRVVEARADRGREGVGSSRVFQCVFSRRSGRGRRSACGMARLANKRAETGEAEMSLGSLKSTVPRFPRAW